MALYPTPAGHRMAYDRDGSGGAYFADSVVLTSMSPAQLQAVNDERDSTFFQWGNGSDFHFGLPIIFPELRDVSGYYLNGEWNGTNAFSSCLIEWSTNTTTGQDGTWSSAAGVIDLSTDTSPAYRSSIQAFSLSAVKAIRPNFVIPGAGGGRVTIRTFHLYGQPSAGQNPDSLRFWQPVTNAEVTTVQDFGDVPRGNTFTAQVRVKNISGTLTANGVTLSQETLSDAAPSLLPQFEYSTDNISYFSTLSLGNLAPGAITGIIYIRDTVASSAALSVWALRTVVVATSWT